VTHVTHGRSPADDVPGVGGGGNGAGRCTSARLHGNYEGGFAMAAVGAGYHDGSAPRSWPAAACIPLTLGRRTGPSWSTRRSCAWWQESVAHAFARSSEAASASWETGTRSSAWSPICGRSPPIGVGARTLSRSLRGGELDPVWSCARRGDAAPLAPRAASPCAGRSMRVCTSGISSPSTTSSHRANTDGGRQRRLRQRLLVALVFSAAGLYRAHGRSPWRVAPARLGSVSHSDATPQHVLRSVFARAGRSARAAASSQVTA